MAQDRARLMRCAAALQCIAAEFRAHIAATGVVPAELERFAGLLDHMAASLLTARALPSESGPTTATPLPRLQLVSSIGAPAS